MPYVWSIYALIRHIFMVSSTNQLSPEKHENLIFTELLDIKQLPWILPYKWSRKWKQIMEKLGIVVILHWVKQTSIEEFSTFNFSHFPFGSFWNLNCFYWKCFKTEKKPQKNSAMFVIWSNKGKANKMKSHFKAGQWGRLNLWISYPRMHCCFPSLEIFKYF